MMIFTKFLILGLLPLGLQAQSLVIRDNTGNVVNGDTIVVVPGATQKPPATELSCYLYVQNMAQATINMGARKTEFIVAASAEHNICFAGLCYTASVFTSPNLISVAQGDVDSSFSGHYRFTQATHTPAIDLVAYTFYDAGNTADSAIVYVKYNSLLPNSQQEITGITATNVNIYPNPANGVVNFFYNIPDNIQAGSASITIINGIGQTMRDQILDKASGLFSATTDEWASGIYYYSLFRNDAIVFKGSFIVTH